MIVADFEKFTLQTGVDFYVHETTKFKTIAIKVYVHQPLGEDVSRIALLPFLLRRGCRKYSTQRKIITFLEELYGASLSADVLKVGERQILYFRMEVVNDRYAPKKIHALRTSLEFLHNLLVQPVLEKGSFRKDFVVQEKENLCRLIRSVINDRMSYALERCIQEMCKGEPYALYEYGKLEEVEALRPKDLTRAHARVLERAPVEIFVVGDVRASAAAAEAARVFQFQKRNPELLLPTSVRSGGSESREVTEKFEVDQGKLVLGARHGITWTSDDVFPLVYYNGLLGGFPHSKLFVNVREREGMAYSAHSSMDYTKGVLFINAGIDSSRYHDCVKVIQEQMDDLTAGKFSEEDFRKTRLMLVDRIHSREDNAAAKIGAFGEMLMNGRPLTPEQIIEKIEAVSREDILRVSPRIKVETVFFLTRDGVEAESKNPPESVAEAPTSSGPESQI